MHVKTIVVVVAALMLGCPNLIAPAVAQDCGYGPGFCRPAVTTGAVANVTDTGGTLTGRVNPNGKATTYAFQLSKLPDFSNSLAFPTEPAPAGAGNADVGVALSAFGLEPSTAYFVRLAATSDAGGTFGNVVQFTTTANGSSTPGVVTGAASYFTQTTATVTGTINPAGREVTYSFAYGPTPAFGAKTPNQTLPAGAAPVAVSADLGGLLAGTTYHYQLVAVNAGGTTGFGARRTLDTLPSNAGGDDGDGGSGRATPREVQLRVTPKRDTAAPFRFSVRGRVYPKAGFSPSRCTGKVRFTVKQGRRTIRTRGTRVRSNCRFHRRFGVVPAGEAGQLKVRARFRGNAELKGRYSRVRYVRFGPAA